MDTTRTGRSSCGPSLLDSSGGAAALAPSTGRAHEAAALTRLVLGNIELAALDTELAYRGPERRNGPAASLAQLLARRVVGVHHDAIGRQHQQAVVDFVEHARQQLRQAGRRPVAALGPAVGELGVERRQFDVAEDQARQRRRLVRAPR